MQQQEAIQENDDIVPKRRMTSFDKYSDLLDQVRIKVKRNSNDDTDSESENSLGWDDLPSPTSSSISSLTSSPVHSVSSELPVIDFYKLDQEFLELLGKSSLVVDTSLNYSNSADLTLEQFVMSNSELVEMVTGSGVAPPAEIS